MRVLGIDPGTGSFDFFGMEDDRIIILDTTVTIPEVTRNPGVILDTVRSAFPLDTIVGPSGYGLPVTAIKDMGEKELNLMVPDDKSIPLYDDIRMVLRLMKADNFPVYFTPGVIHLPTVPEYRKANKMDMGTADKVCCAVLAMRDQAEVYGIDYSETSFILVELGFAFNAIIGVEKGKIVDGCGGTAGGPGFLTLGCMDSELAIRLGAFPGTVLFTGGVKDASDKTDLTPEEMAKDPYRYSASWNMLLEGIVKGVAAMTAVVEKPREIILSGRLSRIPEIAETLKMRLSRFSKVRLINRKASIAKEAAEGACIIADGLMHGKSNSLIETAELRKASGTMFDHILIKGATVTNP